MNSFILRASTFLISAKTTPINTIMGMESSFDEYVADKSTLYWRKQIRNGARPIIDLFPIQWLDREWGKDTIREMKKRGCTFFVVDGHHRLAAYQLEGIVKIPYRLSRDI